MVAVGDDRSGRLAAFREHLTRGSDNQRSSRIVQVGVVADAIGGNDKGLILDGPRDEETSPVMLSRGRPGGADEEEVRARKRSQAPEFRESQVVADKRTRGEGADAREDKTIAAPIRLRLAPDPEGVHLRVGGRDRAVGVRDRALVPAVAVGASRWITDCKVHTATGGLARCPLGRVRRRDGGEIDGEADVEEFRKDSQRPDGKRRAIEERRDRLPVGLGRFPGDVELDRCHAHDRHDSGQAGSGYRAPVTRTVSERASDGKDLASRAPWPWARIALYAVVNFTLGLATATIALPLFLVQDLDDVPHALEASLRMAAILVGQGGPEDRLVFASLAGSSAIVTALQVAFLLPVFRPFAASGRARSLTWSVLSAAFVGAVLASAVAWTVLEAIAGDEEAMSRYGEFTFFAVPIAALVPAWCAWTWVLLRRSTYPDPLGVDRLLRPLLVGTAASLALVIPIDALTRRQKDCYCATGNFVALSLSLAAIGFLVGPFMVLGLSRRCRRRARRVACSACGYARSAREPRCPECGRGRSRRQRGRYDP